MTAPTLAARPVTHPVADSLTMVRRRLVHMRRYPSLTIMLIGQPIVFLLLFAFVFGATMGAGLAGPGGGRTDYLVFITPTILLMTVASVALATALAVATDMTEGIVARFRTMAIARVSVLTGHVVGAVIQTAIALAVVLAVALLLGFRTGAGPLAWLGVVGVLALATVALTWFTVALGLAAGSVETASNTPMFLLLLPFLGSGFVTTDSMPAGLRWFAEHQPFTPIIDTLRGLLTGAPDLAAPAAAAVAWCVVITAASYLWAKRLYARRTDS
ncbi:ABC-2 type transport system permease protein [Actinomycetospora succinea]|uniref:Transport permease protein n=1 Tax=Actinomycetospora succinea TaxID=663603 RepID=A0A4R6UPE6_9PSEU|nr:ABC transporter permease [Actinomycetospora succinea]TDQ47333.1 ABC-2 type transport system permease protein [Actinomycetospora succinea]